MQKLSYLFILVLLMSLGYANSEKIQENARDFLEQYTQQYQKLYYNAAKAEWKSNTFIVEGDTATAAATQRANEALANFTGSRENIEKAKRFLEHREQLSDLQIKQLELILYEAANNPQTVPELVKKRIKAENEQNTKLYGYDFKIEGKSVTTNEIDSILKASSELEQRLDAWQTSKAVGKVLKDGLTQLQNLRNKTVQALGYSDYFSYQVSDFGMETPDMLAICRRFVKEIWPLYRQLHTYARYELAKKYGIDEVPDYLPAHWLPNRWGQDWNAMITVEGFDLDGALNDKSA
ncbi:peptidase, partial [Candidatus Saccharibacteria bacterium]|nr:peptidase [Calditrichia bacterium]NIV71516.1 peptidase [Calditrichia bacterium]NIV98076.1 peptidase [Candidatus Saccharibacteria bacterium]NIW78367.1 peptidase [Calditrichia bacterium]